jgi:putative DNA primase/helicase
MMSIGSYHADPDLVQQLRAAALAYAARGWPVLPCCPATKRPLIARGLHAASTDPEQIRAWWDAHPRAMIAVVTGPRSGFWALDVDVGNGKDGFVALGELEHAHDVLPDTLSSTTPRGGRHLLFKWRGGIHNSASQIAGGIDVRGDGGYIIVPPSVCSNRNSYTWCQGCPEEPAEAPAWLIALASKPKRAAAPAADGAPPSRSNGSANGAYARAALGRECDAVAKAPPGQRNSALNRASFSLHQLVASGELSEVEVQDQLFAAATACGLVKDDGVNRVRATIKSGAAAGLQQPRAVPERSARSQIRPEVAPVLAAMNDEKEESDGREKKEGRKGRGRKRLDLADIIKNGEGGHFGDDRSKAVWWAVNELIRRGKSDDEIVAVLLDRDNRISDQVYDQKQGAEKYARRQVEQARSLQTAAGPDGGLEDGVALEFSTLHARRLRYVALWNKWLQWNGVYWVFEDTLHAYDLSRELCREAGNAKAKTVAAVVTLARADRRQAATVDQWDADLWLLGTPNGTIDLRTGALRPPNPGDYITKVTSVAPGGACPLWLKFLERVTNNDAERQEYLQRVCGYCLTGSTKEEALFFFYGKGANGKSVFLRTVAGIIDHYHKMASMEMFVVTRGERHPTDLAMLRGARLVTAVETEEGKRWDEAKLKALTGGDPIAARFMRQDFFEYIPQFKLMIAGNHKPAIRSVDEAIRRRMNLVPFTVTIPEKERDQELSNKLKAEWPGILRWMIEGCLAWQRDGLKPPKAVTEATDKYLESQDDLQAFIDESCAVAKNESDSVEHLWDGWTDWAEDCGEFVGSKRRFSQRLQDKGFVPVRLGAGSLRHFQGLRCLRENAKKLAEEARRKAREAEAKGE